MVLREFACESDEAAHRLSDDNVGRPVPRGQRLQQTVLEAGRRRQRSLDNKSLEHRVLAASTRGSGSRLMTPLPPWCPGSSLAMPCVLDIPCQFPSSSSRDDAGFGVANSVRPCRGFVVRGAGFQAAMEDTDKPVGELSESRMMTDTSASDRVVIRARPG